MLTNKNITNYHRSNCDIFMTIVTIMTNEESFVNRKEKQRRNP